MLSKHRSIDIHRQIEDIRVVEVPEGEKLECFTRIRYIDDSKGYLIPLNQIDKMQLEISEKSFPETISISKSDDGAVFACVVTQPGMYRIDHLTIVRVVNKSK